MKKIFTIALGLSVLAGGISTSCSSSESVVSNSFIQKRKYNKGFHKSFKKNIKTKDIKEDETLAFVENKSNNSQEVKTIKNTEKSIAFNSVVDNNNINLQSKEVKTKVASENKKTKNNPKKTDKIEKVISKVSNKIEKSISKKSNITSVNDVKDTNEEDIPVWAYYLMAIFIPPVAVGLITDWEVKEVIINLLLCLLCGLPGIIHALIVVSKRV